MEVYADILDLMAVVAYVYFDPALEGVPDLSGEALSLDRLYLDQGRSPHVRPQLQQLLHDAAVNPPHTVIVRRLADFGDSLEAVFTCVETLEAWGITVVALDQTYHSPHPGQAAGDRASLIQLVATIQAQQRSQRLQAGHAQNRINVLPPPGQAPYGYRRGRYRYALDRTTAPVVKAFFEQFLLFGSIRGAVRHLEKAYGKRISASTGQRWLTHPVYRGDLVYKDGKIIRDTHTPIISREEAAQVDRLLRRNRRLPPKTASAERSLAGLVQCQQCQSKLKVSRVTRPRQAQEYLYLRPMQCNRTPACKAIPYDQVLEKTIAAICQTLPQAVADLPIPPVGSLKNTLQTQIDQKAAALTQIPTLLEQGILDDVTANLRAYTLRSELATLQQQRSQLPPENLSQIVQTLSIPQFWQDLSEAERRVYLREFIKTILITRDGNTWDVHVRFVFT